MSNSQNEQLVIWRYRALVLTPPIFSSFFLLILASTVFNLCSYQRGWNFSTRWLNSSKSLFWNYPPPPSIAIPPPYPPQKNCFFSDTTFAKNVPVLLFFFLKREAAASVDPLGELHVASALHLFIYSTVIWAFCWRALEEPLHLPGLVFLILSFQKFHPCFALPSSQGIRFGLKGFILVILNFFSSLLSHNMPYNWFCALVADTKAAEDVYGRFSVWWDMVN